MIKKEFYTHASIHFGKVLYRGYSIDENGVKRRTHGRVNYKPTLYLETDQDSEYKSLFGKNLSKKEFTSIPEAREFTKQYKGVMPVYGYSPSRMDYNFIAQNFPDKLEVGISDLKVSVLDIETEVELGKFPDPKLAEERVTLISITDYATKEVVTYGILDCVAKNYIKVSSEEELLKQFIGHITETDPDILTGWNLPGFDIQYLINRINKILGDNAANSLSPFGVIDCHETEINGRTTNVYTIIGRSILDMLELYKKFTFVKRESYKLENIATIELGVGKLSNPYSTFREFYTKDPVRFIEYNQIDNQRVMELEEKLGLISLALSVAYLTKVNFTDVFSPVKTWEGFILSSLLNERIICSTDRPKSSSDNIMGAYVADPVPGFYDWTVSIDAASLYPSIIIGLNMSPETLVDIDTSITIDKFLSGFTGPNKDYTYGANGVHFRKDVEGILPKLVKKVLDGRSIAKKEMLHLKQQYVDTKDIQYKNKADLQYTLQLALKILANSLFGSLANAGFIFFDNRLAEGITSTGQYIIKKVGTHCDTGFNKFFKTENFKYTIYSDTDSIFFSLGNVVQKYYKDKTDLEITDALDNMMEKHLRKIIDEATDYIADHQNYYKKTIFFKRENICSSGFFVAAKKYALKVYDSEGVRYPEGDYKIMGIEVVRSSTPAIARNALKTCVIHVIDKNIDAVKKDVVEIYNQFLVAPVEDIAFPRSANNLIKYSSDQTIYTKGVPIAVRATLLHNHYVQQYKIEEKYPLINEGGRIKFIYLKEPNHFKENIIAFEDTLPVEFNLHKYVDRELQFQKVFMAPLDGIMKAVGWSLDEKNTLDDFFN